MMDKLKVGIVGVSGYGGGELARLLAHPQVELTYVTSGTYAGQPLRAPCRARRPHPLTARSSTLRWPPRMRPVFLAGESGLAMKVAPLLLEAGKKSWI